MHSNKSFIRQGLQYGVKGYLLKNSVKDELLMAVRAAYQDAIYLSPAISEQFVADLSAGRVNPISLTGFDQLSGREREILKLIAEGYTNKAVAEAMHLSIKTVEKDRAKLMETLQVKDLVGLIRIALKYGLIFINDVTY
jgi:DNA-binding NarL/FixJ family response regulator